LDDEVRTRLAAIVGYAVLLDSDDPGARRDAPRRIVESVQRLTETLERIFSATSEEPSGEEAPEEVPFVRRAVVIDDDPISRGFLKRMFPPEFELLEAGDHEEALELAGADGAEFVVLAWRASTFSGPETLAELKVRFPELPVIVIAEADDDVYRGVAGSLGADQFLTRPLNSHQLLAAANELLGQGEDVENPVGSMLVEPSL
jgi:CheY-like chemotaxis protein